MISPGSFKMPDNLRIDGCEHGMALTHFRVRFRAVPRKAPLTHCPWQWQTIAAGLASVEALLKFYYIRFGGGNTSLTRFQYPVRY